MRDVAQLITATSTVTGANLNLLDAYTDATYIYLLVDPETLDRFYVGSTVNPVSRILSHLQLRTRDTAPVIGPMLKAGRLPVMELVDVTTRHDRLHLEARWIATTPTAVNSTRYREHFRVWQQCPTCYRSASVGTMAQTVQVPAKIGQRELREYRAAAHLHGTEVARILHPEVWAWEARVEALRLASN